MQAYDAFISHASADAVVAKALCEALERAGYPCWIAPRDPHPGRPYAEQIAQAISASRLLILVLSRDANRSRAVLSEVELAVHRGKTVVPFRIDTSEPAEGLEYYIRAVQWFDATQAPLDDRLVECAAFVRDLLREEISAPTTRVPPGGEAAIHSSRPRTNVPRPLSALLGRTSEGAAVRALLERNRLVTITGIGGIGKTRIALDVAAEPGQGFAEGVWFIDLAPLQNADLIAGEICSVLGVQQQAERPVLSTLTDHLRTRKLLLVLDNCEHLIAESSNLCAHLLTHAAELRILATSREPLEIDGESVYQLPPLPTPTAGSSVTTATAADFASIGLFVERAQTALPSFLLTDDNAAVVGEICRRLDGIPLAIELAAARVNVLKVNEIRDRLGERFRILTEGRRTALPRHQTMRAMIDWSFDLLAKKEQVLFGRVAIFAGGWTLDAAEATCAFSDIAAEDILNCLSSLVRKSLVVVDFAGPSTRYRLLESTRAYASEKSRDEAEALAQRHTSWVLDLTEKSAEIEWTTPLQTWLMFVGAEIDNIRAAIVWALRSDHHELTAANIVGRLSSFWYEAALQAEGGRWIDAAMGRIDAELEPLIAGRLLRATAFITSAKRAVSAGSEAVRLLERVDAPLELAIACKVLAFGLWQTGNLVSAEAYSARACSFFKDSSAYETRFCSDTLGTRASILCGLGRDEEARALYQEAVTISLRVGDERGSANLRGGLAELEFAAGDTERALQLAEDAAETFRRLGADSREATALVNRATYLLRVDRIDEAQSGAREALRLARRTKNKPVIVVAMQDIALTYALRRSSPAAARLSGYVNEWYLQEGFEQESSERRVHEALNDALRTELSEEQLLDYGSQGAALSEDEATTIALAN